MRLRSLTLVLTVPAVLVGLALPVSPVLAAPDRPAPDLTLVAHRGAPTRTLGENTLPAFRHALRDGATAIETDLRRTKDDQLVVLHDSGVGRTTDCAGPIGIWTLKRLTRQCREDTTGKPLPTAVQLMDFLARHDASAMIELKGKSWSPAQLATVVELLRASPAFDRVAISSLRVQVLRRLHRLAPRLDTQLIVSGWPKVNATVGDVAGYNVPAGALTRARVRRLHRRGLVVVGGYADSPSQWRRLARLRVDGVVTPSVRRYERWARTQRP